MKFLDWMKDRNRLGLPKGSELDPKTHGHETWRGLQSEIESDTKLGRMRDETGREPRAFRFHGRRRSQTRSNTVSLKCNSRPKAGVGKGDMGFIDWIGRERDRPTEGAEPKVTWMSDVYTYRTPDAPDSLKGSWAWAWVRETPSGKFDAGITVNDHRFNFTKWKTGEGFSKESEGISVAQRRFRA